jgi:hypothetical protein
VIYLSEFDWLEIFSECFYTPMPAQVKQHPISILKTLYFALIPYELRVKIDHDAVANHLAGKGGQIRIMVAEEYDGQARFREQTTSGERIYLPTTRRERRAFCRPDNNHTGTDQQSHWSGNQCHMLAKHPERT